MDGQRDGKMDWGSRLISMNMNYMVVFKNINKGITIILFVLMVFKYKVQYAT